MHYYIEDGKYRLIDLMITRQRMVEKRLIPDNYP
jgi:hypothetical protein